MSLWVNIGILSCIVISAVIVIIISIVKYGKEELSIDSNIGINVMAKYCDGRAIGVEKDIKLGKEGRKIISFSPRDVNPYLIDTIEDVPVIVDKNKCIPFPKGSWSKDKNINIYLPPTPDDFPEPFKNNILGQALMLVTSIINSDNAEIDAFKEGMKRQMAHTRSMAAGEVSLERINQMEEIFSDLLDAAKDSKKDNKFPTGGMNIPPR
jgi:hypothetical protein